MQQPAYFEAIRHKASNMWAKLEHEPELAGPWHQLFKQVQSPRHVVSELLQNADDAGATSASVIIEDGVFVFSHNGEDFKEEHFASLCHFGYSNKRTIHTIGFRGIGFKSTFSLGNEVQLFTPTLSVVFHKDRFTEPIWISDVRRNNTEVRVKIIDSHRVNQLNKNFNEWLDNPTSLLFFKHIRKLQIQQKLIEWQSQGKGPVENTEWMSLANETEKKYLVIHSRETEFPEDALNEIRQERMISAEDDIITPACQIDLVLGMEGRLYVVLPTGVKTALPFASNAPLIQDPARLKIKDPETSPTNRWLLKVIGELAANTMLAWINNRELSVDQRCHAYDLLPDVDREDASLEGSCATACELAFKDIIDEKKFLITEQETLTAHDNCISLPKPIMECWSKDQLGALFHQVESAIINNFVSQENLEKFYHWGFVTEIEKATIIKTLQQNHLPKPGHWGRLFILWNYLAEDIMGQHWYQPADKTIRIFPVQGAEVLYSASEVVRLGEKKLLQSEDDWDFLSQYLHILNQNWTRYLAKLRRKAEEQNNHELTTKVNIAYKLLENLELGETSDVSDVVNNVAGILSGKEECPASDHIRVAHIAAKLGASVNDNFLYVTCDNERADIEYNILADMDNDLDMFIEHEWLELHKLHEDYFRTYISCTENEWKEWVNSEHSKLLKFIPINKKSRNIYGKNRLESYLADRGYTGEIEYAYKTENFIVEDLDFDEDHWQHWDSLGKTNQEIWERIFTKILKQPTSFWNKCLDGKALHIATNGSRRTITTESITPEWIYKFRNLPCLQDTWGKSHAPAELLRRTAQTEALLNVEPFVRAEFDNEATRPLLIALGVGDTPADPVRLLERLRTLSKLDSLPVYEIEKWYNRIDQMLNECSTEVVQEIKDAFYGSNIVFTSDDNWLSAHDVYLNPDEEVLPGAPQIHPLLRNLSLWHKLGIADRPSLEISLEWLTKLPAGSPLTQDQIRRLHALLPRYPEQIWNQCQHWLNLEGQWVPVENLKYSISMQSLVMWKHLFPDIKQQTADLQKLSSDICQRYPLSTLSSLALSIENRFEKDLFNYPDKQIKPWLNIIGKCLCRIDLNDKSETDRIRELGHQLVNTQWCVLDGLETIPYINNVPVGTRVRVDVLWQGSVIFVQSGSMAKIAKSVANEIGKIFGRAEITDAIKLCYDRSAEFIIEYMEENFQLIPQNEILVESITNWPLNETQTWSEEVSAQPESIITDTDELHEQEEYEINPDLDSLLEGIMPDQQEQLEVNVSQSSRGQSPRHSAPSLIERFATANGYRKDGQNRFYSDSGSWIAKSSDNSCIWHKYSKNGDIVQNYFPREHCLEKAPLKLDAEIWWLIERNPGFYSLILLGLDDAPVELTGAKLQDLHDKGLVKLFPASYRLVYNQSDN